MKAAWRQWLQGAVGLLLCLGLVTTARAQDEDINTSPRAAVRAFLESARTGHYQKAAQASFPPTGTGPGFDDPTLTARELKAVLDTYLQVDLSKISDDPEGRTDDRLGHRMDEIGRVPAADNQTEGIRLVKLPNIGWVFSAATLNRVPTWYENLPDHWIRERLPEPLLRAGPRDVLWWQWIAMPVLLFLSFLLGRLVAIGIRLALSHFARRASSTFNELFVKRLEAPLTLLTTVLVADVLVDFLILTIPAQQFIHSVVSALVLASVFWAALRMVDLGIETLRGAAFAKGRAERLALLPLFSKAAKIGLSVIAGIEVLQKLGYPAASLIAGLGIGGLAFALAAQKTVENLFGSVILGVDQPFRPGDTVKIDDLVGTVEIVGLRSTRIRTATRTMVTIPNGRLSDMRIETFATRDRQMLAFTISLVYSTTSEQMRNILAEILSTLRGMPDIYLADPPTAFFSKLSTNSLDVDITAWLNTLDYTKFQIVRQDVLLRVMEIVERNGSRFAMPTRTVEFARPPKELLDGRDTGIEAEHGRA